MIIKIKSDIIKFFKEAFFYILNISNANIKSVCDNYECIK